MVKVNRDGRNAYQLLKKWSKMLIISRYIQLGTNLIYLNWLMY